MFISDKFVFLELHKTGCTHIRKTLNYLLDGELIGSHNQASRDLFTEERIFLGSIRDPWEWYISLWAYGCDNKGGVFHNLLHSKNRQRWRETYINTSNAEAFRTWLHMMHDPENFADIGEGYSECSVSRISGLMTYRYLYLFCTKVGEQQNLNQQPTFENIKNYDNENCFIDRFIRTENLEANLFRCIEEFGVNIPNNMKSEVLSIPKSNTSSRKFGPEYYYDIRSENLVAERERLIIDKFGYIAPSLRKTV